MSSEVQYQGYYARDSTGSDYENSRSPNADDGPGSPNGYEFDEDSQDSLSDFSSIHLDGYDGADSQHTSFGQRHNSIGSESALANANGGSSNRKRAFSNAASSNGSAEKRTATKICRVCGDKAYSYNFNVITCESCKAFFRRNANKEKDIRCPFNEQCDINLVSRRFCQKCRLDKCFRVGMKKEWIMSEEARLEKKQRIQDNRERRMAERDRSGVEDSSPPGAPATTMPQETQFMQQTTTTLPMPAVQVPVLPASLIPTAPLLGQPPTDLAQQLANASCLQPSLTLEPSTQPAAIAAAAAGFMPPGFPEPQNANGSPILPSTASVQATAAAAQTIANQQIVNQQIVNAQAQLAAAQVAQVAQAAQAAQVVQAVQAHHQAQIEHQMQQHAAQQLQQHVNQQAAHLQHQRMEMRELHAAQSIVVAQQHQAAAQAAQQIVAHQQQQLAAAVVAAAASAMQQPPQQTVGTTAAEIVAAATAPALPPVLPTMAPQTVAATVTQLVPPLEVTPPAPSNPSQELIAVPKDVLIKLVEQKIENDQHQQQLAQQEVKPVKCLCHCQCGRYPNEMLIVDKVMADLLESSSQHSHRADSTRLESTPKRETESSTSEPMDTSAIDPDFCALNVTDSAYLAEILQANSVWANPVEGTNDDALRRLIKMLGRITGFRILSRQDQIALVRNTCEEYFILRSAMSQATNGNVWSGPPLGYPLNAEAQAAILERGVMFYNVLREEWRGNDSIMFLLGLIVLFNHDVADLQSRESVAAENHKHRSLLKKTLFTLRQEPQRAYIEYCELMNKLSELKLSLGRLNTDTVEPLMREVFDPASIAVTLTTGHFVNSTMV